MNIIIKMIILKLLPVILDLIITGLEHCAENTDSSIDDDIVKSIKENKDILEDTIRSIS